MKVKYWLAILVIGFLGLLVLFLSKGLIGHFNFEGKSIPTSTVVPVTEVKTTTGVIKDISESEEAKEVSLEEKAFKPNPEHVIKILNIPFTSQAPKANWDAPYQDACEEASMLMVAEYFSGNHSNSLAVNYADQKILQLVDWQKQNRGFYESTTAQEVVSILHDYWKLAGEVVPFGADRLKQEILAGHPVILPAAGRLLGNPYFRQPGPLYHMLVVKGYEGDTFITNDPGTRHGFNYEYTTEVLTTAVHDWNNGVVEEGARVMIVVSGSIL